MPFNEALFWFGLTAFGTGLYFWVEAAVKRLYSIGLTVIGALACAYAVYRHYHPESPAIRLWVMLLIFTWALLGYVVYLSRFRRLPPSPAEKPEEPSKLVIHRAVYAAGLPTEVSVTDKLQNMVRGGIAITVDGTLGGLIPDPAFGIHKRLDVDYSYGTDTVFHVSRTERPAGEIMRLILPEDSEVRRLEKEIGQLKAHPEKQSQYPIPALRAKVLLMISELQGFIGAHGPEPEVKHNAQEEPQAYMQRFRNAVMPWRAKVLGDFRLTFGDSLPRLQDEIRGRAGIDDFVLNNLIVKASNDPNGKLQVVEELAKRLWDLAYLINA